MFFFFVFVQNASNIDESWYTGAFWDGESRDGVKNKKIVTEPYRLTLGQNCKNESCSAGRFKYKSAFIRSKNHKLEKNRKFCSVF